MAFLPVCFSQRCLMISVYTEDFSITLHFRPSFRQDIRVDPLPPNGSRTKSSRFVRTFMYGISNSRGLVPNMISCPEDFLSAAIWVIKSVGQYFLPLP